MNIYVNKKINLIKQSLPEWINVNNMTELNKNYLIDNQIRAMFIRSNEKITKELIQDTLVEFIATATSGTDHIEEGVKHYSAPGSNANSVAEYVIYSISKYLNKIKSENKHFKLGIIGYGNIGKLVAYYANQIGFEIFVNDPPLKDDNFVFPSFCKHVDLAEIFEGCSIITNHVPLTFSGKYPTFNLINKDLLKLVQPNSLFIHTSRGGIVNQLDLIEAIRNQNLFTIIDVWDNEPLFDIELAKLAFMATPHIAGYSYDGIIKASIIVLQHFKNHFGIDVNINFQLDELNKREKKSIEEFKDLFELEQLLNEKRRFIEDNIDYSLIRENDIESKKSYFINYRANYPKRYELLKVPNEYEITI